MPGDDSYPQVDAFRIARRRESDGLYEVRDETWSVASVEARVMGKEAIALGALTPLSSNEVLPGTRWARTRRVPEEQAPAGTRAFSCVNAGVAIVYELQEGDEPAEQLTAVQFSSDTCTCEEVDSYLVGG